MAKEIMSDERVRELQEEWNPAQYDTEPDGFTKDMLIRVSSTFYNMSVEEYRKVLEEQASSGDTAA